MEVQTTLSMNCSDNAVYALFVNSSSTVSVNSSWTVPVNSSQTVHEHCSWTVYRLFMKCLQTVHDCSQTGTVHEPCAELFTGTVRELFTGTVRELFTGTVHRHRSRTFRTDTVHELFSQTPFLNCSQTDTIH